MVLSVVIWTLITLRILKFIWRTFRPTNYPPGPIRLPVIGNVLMLHMLKKRFGYMHLAFEHLASLYGPILGIKLGKDNFVVISGNALVKKALLMDEFNGRPNGFFFRVRSFGKEKGVLFTEGKVWSQHRRFTLRHLKAFGLGSDTMVQQLHSEANSLVAFLKSESKKGAVAMHTAFDVSVLNALWQMFAGRRFEHDDEKVKEILDVVHEVFRLSDTLGGVVSYMPILRYIIPETSGYNHMMKTLKQLWGFLNEEIISHESSLPQDHPRDLIDAFLMQIRERGNEQEEDDSIFDRENLLVLCLDLFLAGSKTTTDTLALIFAYLGLNLHWVKELQKELKDVIGRNRAPKLSDANQLPKTEAFLAEAMRYLIMAPLGIPRRTLNDVYFEGYTIPKDTMILLNFNSANNDPTVWNDPEEFRPSRFLDRNGKFKPLPHALPFGLGKRRCLGEGLARHSLFLYFVTVLHNFDISLSEEHPPPELLGYDGFVIAPKPYYFKLTPRTD